MVKYRHDLSAIFKCLADGGRRAMLDRLVQGDATLSQLAQPLDMTLPAVHQHLAVLEAAGLVSCEKRGRERWCRLEREPLQAAEDWIAARRASWEGRLDALGAYLEANRRAQRKQGRSA